MYCVQVIKPEPFLGLSRRSGRYWLLVLRGTGKDGDFHPFTFYGNVLRLSGILGYAGAWLKSYPTIKINIICTQNEAPYIRLEPVQPLLFHCLLSLKLSE